MNSDELELIASEPIQGMDEMMEDFVHSSARSGNSPREMYLMRETMHSLLRLAQSKQLLEIRRSVDKLVPVSMRPACKRRRAARDPAPGQTQFVFGRDT